MTSRADLKRLGKLTGMMLEMRLADLHRAAALREECEARLKAIQTPPPPAEGLAGAAPELAQLTYQKWVDLRRQEINRQLAQRTAEWLEAADAARVAFGKDQALTGLAAKLLTQRPDRKG